MSTRFRTLSLDAMGPEQRAVADEILDTRKTLNGPFNSMLRSPELASHLHRIGAYLRFKSPLPQRIKEMAILIVARHWSSQYEWYAHRRLAIAAGFTEAKCDVIATGHRPDDLDTEEAIVFDFVRSLLTSGYVQDAHFEALAQHFGENGVADCIGIVGYYCAVSFFLNVDQFPLPPEVERLQSIAQMSLPEGQVPTSGVASASVAER